MTLEEGAIHWYNHTRELLFRCVALSVSDCLRLALFYSGDFFLSSLVIGGVKDNQQCVMRRLRLRFGTGEQLVNGWVVWIVDCAQI
ncbi:hypothetical protein QVD17_23705 [Tagetes erecta]|uniref:Uncharacterized protein n=1 Tax=Tagetes erecta TaxID=13708 RepID=A0AAD8NU81_TARER|nr:hypothetical protein QVD17_23705 [Tagetes erecta]